MECQLVPAFSATMPKEIANIAKKYMKDSTELAVGKKNSGSENVKHIYYVVQTKDRYAALKRIVDMNPDIYSIIFCVAFSVRLAESSMPDNWLGRWSIRSLRPTRSSIASARSRRSFGLTPA